LPSCEPSGLLGASVESAQSPPCGLKHQHLLRWRLENLRHLGDSSALYNSLGKHPTLLGQPLLIDDLEDYSDVCKVFLVVPMGVNGHTEVGLIQKLDLGKLRFFLGRDNVNLRYVQNGWPIAQLPFLALCILQPVRRLEGGTHFGMLPESGTKQDFFERRLQWNS
jgi:hypothetical protein